MGTTLNRGTRKPRRVQGMKEDVVNPEPTKSEHVSIDAEAAGIIRGPRAKFYGHPKFNLTAIADAWQAYLSTKHKTKVTVDAHDVCNLMILLKAMRAGQGYHRDSAVDIVGYALLDEVLSEEEATRAYEQDVLGLWGDE